MNKSVRFLNGVLGGEWLDIPLTRNEVVVYRHGNRVDQVYKIINYKDVYIGYLINSISNKQAIKNYKIIMGL